MSSRDSILAAVKANQPALTELPEVMIPQSNDNLVEKYTSIATGIGSKVYEVERYDEIISILAEEFDASVRIISSIPELSSFAGTDLSSGAPHDLENVELAILKADLAVAENGALWVPEANSVQRVLPFITQHLALVVSRATLVPTMHEAYEKIGNADYGYSAFIAGPSKTADIEQSLVLGAHGPRSMRVFLMP